MEKKDAISELPLVDGSVIPKIQQKNNDVPDQPYGWQGTMEYSPLFEPMEEEDEKKEKREEEGEGEEKKREEIEEEIASDIYAEEENNSEEEGEKEEEEEGAYGEYFVVSEKMEEGRIKTQVEEAAQELAEFSQYTTSNMDPDWDDDAHEAYEIQEMKKKMNKEEKKEIQGARADKVSGVYTICQEYEKTKEQLTGLWLTCETYSKAIKRLRENKRKRDEEKEEEEQSRKKLKLAKRELLWESYLKLKMIEEDNAELLKLLQVCQVMEKIKRIKKRY